MAADSSDLGAPHPGYGSHPVSIDLARSQRVWTRADGADAPGPLPRQPGYTTRRPNCLLHLASRRRPSLQHFPASPWPTGYRIFVCAIAGGVGRTTVAGLLATTLIETPAPAVGVRVSLGQLEPGGWSTAEFRWRKEAGSPFRTLATESGSVYIATDLGTADGQPLLVIDVAIDLWLAARALAEEPSSSVVLVTRPDGDSIRRVAEALLWLCDHGFVDRSRLHVVVNDGTGPRNHTSKSATTAIGIRAASVHQLPRSSALGPASALPSGDDLPKAVRNVVVDLCLALHHSAAGSRPAAPEVHL